MEDDFYVTTENAQAHRSVFMNAIADAYHYMLSAPVDVLSAAILGLFCLLVVTRLLSSRTTTVSRGNGLQTVTRLPHWIPIFGHGPFFLLRPLFYITQASDENLQGIFSLKVGSSILNIATKPGLVNNLFKSSSSSLAFQPIAWQFFGSFLGIPKTSKEKYAEVWEDFTSNYSHLDSNPVQENILKRTIRNLQNQIPQMISFIDTNVDLQPWERSANHHLYSSTEVEVDLFSLIADLLGNATVPAVFGQALLEKHPGIMHDMYDMDSGILFLLIGLPAWFPWPSSMKAHRARHRLWQAFDDYQRALDAESNQKQVDSSWGGLDDVSEFINKRHAFFGENDFKIIERPDLIVLWALAAKTNIIAFWQLFYILSTPGFLERIRSETALYTEVTKPFSIGPISEAPGLNLKHEELLKKCPLLLATYLETLRLVTQPCSIRKLSTHVEIKAEKSIVNDSDIFLLREGEYVAAPHFLNFRDKVYYKDPESFNPQRFLVEAEDGSIFVDAGDIRLYGEDSALFGASILQEISCLSLVAGIVAMWDITPTSRKGIWNIPEKETTSFVARPIQRTRVRVKRRLFDWDEKGKA